MTRMDGERSGRTGRSTISRSDGSVDRPGPIVAIVLSGGLVALFPGASLADDTDDDTDATDRTTEAVLPAPVADGTPAGGGMIPRDAIVEMTRAQSGVICSSETFLGCMGFDGGTCLSLAESAIARCLMPLPAQIDPATLDNATLEACPRTIYERAGFDEAKANACFERALDDS